VGKGILAGLLSGTALSAVMFGALSLMAPPPVVDTDLAAAGPAAAPDASATEAPAGDATKSPQVVPGTGGEAGQAATAAAPSDAGETAAAEPAEAAGEEAVSAPEVKPEAEVIDVPAGSEFARGGADAPATVPGAEDQPAAPETAALPEPAPEAAPALAETMPEAPSAATEPETMNAPEGGAPAPATPAAESPASIAAAAPSPSPAAAAEETPPAAVPAPEPLPATPEGETAETAPAEPSGSEAPPQSEPPQIVFDAPEPPQGIANAPKPGFAKTVPGVKVNRLPTVGETAQAAPSDDAASPEAAPETGTAAVPAAEMPLKLFAAKFANAGDLPLLGVVVIDAGPDAAGGAVEDILALPQPVTVALDPLAPDAADRAARYRAAGFEVAILLDSLPDAGEPADVEVAWQTMHQTMPEAVLAMASPSSAFQSRRAAAQQVVSILGAEGLALATYTRGLNPAREAAVTAGVPQTEIARVPDQDKAAGAALVRMLDRAAFDAGQKGRTVIALHNRPETLTALAEFLQKGAGGAVIAPLTAVIADEAAN